MLDKIKSIPAEERAALPGQVKSKMVRFLTGRTNPIVYPWEDPYQAAQDMGQNSKIEFYVENRREAEGWLLTWFAIREETQ